jgi:O-antigen/teichoic acid export membrane protein
MGTALPTSAVLAQNRLVRLFGRYSLSAVGPIAVSAAHFAASLIFLHKLAPAEFGMFSFLLVVVPFCLSISSGLLGAPLLNAIGKAETIAEAKRAAFREVNRFYCLAAGIVTAALMYFSDAGKLSALLLGFYGAAMTFRWFARFSAYNSNQAVRAAASDFVYSAVLLSGLLFLVATDHLSLRRTSGVMLASALLGLLPYGWEFLKSQLRRPQPGFFAVYGPIWRDITRWSLLGVVLSEMTANAHAYLVTFVSGTQAFALLAVGSLMMRPLSLVLAALPDRERPVIARYLATGDVAGALRTMNEFRLAAAATWLGTVALSAAILIWFPKLVIRSGFDAHSVVLVVSIWTAIAAVRAIRAPENAFLIAAGEFHPLARAGMVGSAVSLIGTLLLLLLFGPVVSLLGILAGEAAMTVRILIMMAAWRRVHA